MVKHQPDPLGPEVLLAFPCSVEEALEPQQVHNFLPIRSYGFKFIVQANFDLTSNREAIDESSERNCAIKDILPRAFLSAVHLLNKSEDERLMWTEYLPGLSTLQDFFASVDMDPLLKESKVLFSHKGNLMRPTELIFVPRRFRFTKHQPVPLVFNERRVLSTRYDRCMSTRYDWCNVTLRERLGVALLDEKTFVAAIKTLAKAGWPEISWHENLARILLKIENDLLMDIDLIPVDTREGIRWEKPDVLDSSPIYFHENHGDHSIPDGVNFQFVSVEASTTKYRRELFEKLGVGSLTPTAICEGISRALTNGHLQTPISIAVAQTKFLFQNRETYWTQKLNFGAVDGKVKDKHVNQHEVFWKEASILYFNDPRQSPYMISQLLKSMDGGFYILHPDYLQHDPLIVMDDWMDWLVQVGLSAKPRPLAGGLFPKVSPAFTYFAKFSSEKRLCKVVLRHWEFYKEYLHVIADLLEERLNQRILPSEFLQSAAIDMNVPSLWSRFLDVDVSEKDEADYRLLGQFGLITQDSALFYLEILRYQAQRITPDPLGRQLLYKIYTSLQSCSDDATIRTAFANRNLLQSGPLGIPVFIAGLSAQYPDCEELFRNMLGIPSIATMKHMATELRHLATSGDLKLTVDHVKPVLFWLSILLSRAKEDRSFGSIMGSPEVKEEIQDLKIWPITTGEAKTLELVSSQKFSSDNFLFVPDRADLYELLRYKVPLLDFTPSEISEIQPLRKWFPGARLLSKEVQKKLSYSAELIIFPTMTSELRQKNRGILRCVRHYLPSLHAEVGGQLHRKLKNITVYEVDKVDCVLSVHKYPPKSERGGGLFGTPASTQDKLVTVKTSGDVVLQQDPDRFTIYLTRDESLRKRAKCYSIPERL
ncbi:MAG: hypothetical protein Q9226_008685, partial [Calogaya cf. arnoldii]